MSKPKFMTRNHESFTHADPLLALVRGRLHISPWLGTLIGGLLINLPLVALAWTNNFWFDRDGMVGLGSDAGWWALQLTLMPATIFYYLWGPDAVCGVLQGLIQNRVIVIPPNDERGENPFDDFIARFDASFSDQRWVVFGFIAAVVFVAVIVPVHRTFNNWMVLDEIAFWYTELFWLLMSWIVFLLVAHAAIVVVWFNRLFQEFRVNVKPLHKDGAGGLAPLGNFSVKLGYLIGIYGIAVAATALTQSYLITRQFGSLVFTTPILIMLTIYLVLSPLAFFAPIGTAHFAMEKAKNEILARIAEQLEGDLGKIQSSLTLDAEELKINLDKIEQLHRAHALVSRFPVWPVNTANLVRFFSSVLSPIAIAVAPTVGNLISRFI